jgi:hypothetical protein
MGKLIGYLSMLSGIILLFYLFGLSGETSLVAFLLDPTGYASTSIYITLLGIIGVFIALGAVSYFVSSSFKIDFLALSPMILIFLGYLAELLSIWVAIAQASGIVAALLISPIFLPFILAIIEWWRGVG